MLTVLLSSQCSSFAAFTEATDPFITSGLTDSSILRCWQLLPLILLILWFKYVIVFISDDIPSNLYIHLTWVPQPRNLQATLFSMCVSQPGGIYRLSWHPYIHLMWVSQPWNIQASQPQETVDSKWIQLWFKNLHSKSGQQQKWIQLEAMHFISHSWFYLAMLRPAGSIASRHTQILSGVWKLMEVNNINWCFQSSQNQYLMSMSWIWHANEQLLERIKTSC